MRPETSGLPSSPVDKSISVHLRSPYLLYLTPENECPIKTVALRSFIGPPGMARRSPYVSGRSLSLLMAASSSDQRLVDFLHLRSISRYRFTYVHRISFISLQLSPVHTSLGGRFRF